LLYNRTQAATDVLDSAAVGSTGADSRWPGAGEDKTLARAEAEAPLAAAGWAGCAPAASCIFGLPPDTRQGATTGGRGGVCEP